MGTLAGYTSVCNLSVDLTVLTMGMAMAGWQEERKYAA